MNVTFQVTGLSATGEWDEGSQQLILDRLAFDVDARLKADGIAVEAFGKAEAAGAWHPAESLLRLRRLHGSLEAAGQRLGMQARGRASLAPGPDRRLHCRVEPEPGLISQLALRQLLEALKSAARDLPWTVEINDHEVSLDLAALVKDRFGIALELAASPG